MQSVFLYGPHGMGKTVLAKAAVNDWVAAAAPAAAPAKPAWVCYLPLAEIVAQHGAGAEQIVRTAFRVRAGFGHCADLLL